MGAFPYHAHHLQLKLISVENNEISLLEALTFRGDFLCKEFSRYLSCFVIWKDHFCFKPFLQSSILIDNFDEALKILKVNLVVITVA